jgi:hypothetical protein
MRRNAIVTVAVVIVLLALGSQLAIPAYVSSRVEDRLTAGGGTAHVSVKAFPALTLLGGSGKRIDVTASGLRLAFPSKGGGGGGGGGGGSAFDRLDGFDEVHAHLSNVHTGPFQVARMNLDRGSSGAPYHVVLEAQADPHALTQYAEQRLGVHFGGFLAGIFGVAPLGDQPVPVHIDARLDSQGGRPHVISANGDIAGLPVNPITEALAAALVARI